MWIKTVQYVVTGSFSQKWDRVRGRKYRNLIFFDYAQYRRLKLL